MSLNSAPQSHQVVSSLVSLSFNLFLALFGGNAKLYAYLASCEDTCSTSVDSIPVMVLCCLAVVLNLAFRTLIFLEKRKGTLNMDQLQENLGRSNLNLTKLLLMSIVFLGFAGLRLIEVEATRFAVISMGFAFPLGFILAEEEIASYAGKKMAALKIVNWGSNLIHPLT